MAMRVIVQYDNADEWQRARTLAAAIAINNFGGPVDTVQTSSLDAYDGPKALDDADIERRLRYLEDKVRAARLV